MTRAQLYAHFNSSGRHAAPGPGGKKYRYKRALRIDTLGKVGCKCSGLCDICTQKTFSFVFRPVECVLCTGDPGGEFSPYFQHSRALSDKVLDRFS